MKTSDWMLICGAALAGYFLFLKPAQEAAKAGTVASGAAYGAVSGISDSVNQDVSGIMQWLSSLTGGGGTTTSLAGVKDTLASSNKTDSLATTTTTNYAGVKETLLNTTQTTATNTGLNVADPLAVAALGNSARFATSVTSGVSGDPLLSKVTTTGGGAYTSWRKPANEAERTAARAATMAQFKASKKR